MPNELFYRELKSEPLTVITAQTLSKIEVSQYQILATYTELKKLSDGSELKQNSFPVVRSRASLLQEEADWIAQGAAFIEAWRQQDEDEAASEKAKADAEALRWAALTAEEQKAERDAARAAVDVQVSDPTPLGP
jgi:hypothetical protein